MTTLRAIELTCPICFTTFTSQAVLSTNAFGGKATDFRERATGTQPLPYLVHTCSSCGYTGNEHDFGEGADPGPTIKEHVLDELAPKLSAGPLAGSDKYEFAATIADWQGCEPRRIAELLLRAAWCCADEDDTEAERYFRRKAAWAFERALAGYDGVARDERAVLTYLVGELWRRVGDTRKAQVWFDMVPDEITDPRTQQWVADAARQQRDRAREWFG
jgi:uncharacterized protein